MRSENNIINYILSISILAYLVFICFSLMNHQTIISDDLAKFAEIKSAKGTNLYSFVRNFLNTPTMAPRPISGIVTAILIYVSQYDNNIYFLGLLLFPISCIFLYSIFKKNTSNTLAILITVFYALSLIGSSTQFSVIMLNSSLALIFYILSFYFLKNRSQNFKNCFISSALFTLSILSYEVFIPCLLINLIFINRNKHRLIYFGLTVSLIILYRKGIQPYIFENNYERENVSSILDFRRDLYTLILIIKMFLKDYSLIIYRSFFNIYKINILELILIILSVFTTYITILKTDFSRYKNDILVLFRLGILGLFLSTSIFFFSTYKPSLFGFENRNLAGIRLFFSITNITILLLAFKKLNKKLMAGIISIYVFIIFITNISIKNAWIYASDFNNHLFSSLAQDLKGKKYDCVSIDYGFYNFIKKDENLIAREPTFYNNWEADYLCFKNGIDQKQIKVYSIERKKCNIIYHYPTRKFVIDDH